MKILYLHQYFNTPDMSGGTRSYEMARRLVASGHEVHMVTSWCGEDKGKDWFNTEEAGIQVHWIPVPYSNKMSYWQRMKAFFKFARKAGQKARQIGGDMVFATSTPLTIALPAVYASKKLKVPMVFEVRDLWPELPIVIGALNNPFLQKIAIWLERWAYKNSEAVVALSPGMKAGVVRAGYLAERIATIPNSSDNAFFRYDERAAAHFRSERSWLGNRSLIVYTGTFGKINGVVYIVDVACELAKIAPDVRILLIGDGMEYEAVKSKATDAGVLNKNLFIEASVSKKQVPAVLSAANLSASLFIDLPEMQANSANKFFDTLASGTPIFLNYGGWQADLVESAHCGYVGWRKPIEQVAQEIALLLDDTDKLNNYGSNARKLALEVFDRDLLANRLEKVLLLAYEREGQKASSCSIELNI